MEIKVGKTAGFCFGVSNAVTQAEEYAKKGEKLYCLGEIVHNRQVTEELENKGITFINNIDEAEGKVIIRSHGVAKEVYDEARERRIETIDLTCPKVLRIHDIASRYSKNGYYIFLIGEKTHPENIGTVSFCGESYTVIENEENLDDAMEKFNTSGLTKLLLISQTTYSLEGFENIKNHLSQMIGDSLEVINTICNATKSRQEETEKLSKEVDLMIIIGGKNSSNTQKLYNISKDICKKAIHVETKEELDEGFIKRFNKIGIMAGASTPQQSISDVVEYLKIL